MSSKESRSRVLGDQNLMKNALQRAADLRGQALSDFVLAAAYERAVATISAEQVLSLSAADSTRFAEAIIQPVVVDTALRDRFILAYPVTQAAHEGARAARYGRECRYSPEHGRYCFQPRLKTI